MYTWCSLQPRPQARIRSGMPALHAITSPAHLTQPKHFQELPAYTQPLAATHPLIA